MKFVVVAIALIVCATAFGEEDAILRDGDGRVEDHAAAIGPRPPTGPLVNGKEVLAAELEGDGAASGVVPPLARLAPEIRVRRPLLDGAADQPVPLLPVLVCRLDLRLNATDLLKKRQEGRFQVLKTCKNRDIIRFPHGLPLAAAVSHIACSW